MKKYVIIVAGGKGLRMGSDLPKQFLPMGDKPVLMHTTEVFRRYDETLQIIVVLPREQQDFWKQLCQKHSFAVEHTLPMEAKRVLLCKERSGTGAGAGTGRGA